MTFDEDLGLLSPRPDEGEEQIQSLMATKIQARYRGKVGRETAKKKEMKEQNNAATKMQANFRGHRARMQQAKEFAEQNNAATKIQAIHRGKKTRKSLNNSIKKEEEKEITPKQDDKTPRLSLEEAKEQEQAAIKLQSRMRGNQARKHFFKKKEEFEKQLLEEVKYDSAEEEMYDSDKDIDNKNNYSSRLGDAEVDNVVNNNANEFDGTKPNLA